MNPFQDKVAAWLSRAGPERTLNQCFNLQVVLATDIGLQRTENQDRVAALRISAKSSAGRPLIAIAVADGMGGMRDGGACATLAMSSFFYALTLYRGHDLQRRATASISHANEEVFKFAGGKGGATLSAVLLDHDLRPFLVNLGDSRIYAFDDTKVERLTRDDSLAEAVGGHGRELLQFVGMGAGMQPHVQAIPAGTHNLAITTDGIHFIEASTLESILSHANELKPASERLAALARWCGGPDNASSAMIDLKSLSETIRSSDVDGIEIWDSSGSLIPIWIRDSVTSAGDKVPSVPAFQPLPDVEHPPSGREDIGRPKAKSTAKRKRTKKKVEPKEDIQLEIKIEQSPGSDEADENSR
jgi:serine/threonine protein phosphatase PrpC